MRLIPKFDLIELIKVTLQAVVFASIFTSLFYQHFKIPSGSMMPNLITGDTVLVQKFAYGYSKYSFPLNMIPFSGKILNKHNPKRGDIVVFKMPEYDNEFFIKRVIGLPGDVIEIKKGIVHINKNVNYSEFVQETSIKISGQDIPIYTYLETNIDNFSYFIYKLSQHGMLQDDNFAPIVIPSGYYFVMGDNRNNSKDSRYKDIGLIAEDKIIGKAQIIFFSSSCKLYEISKWSDQIYWKRMFKRIDQDIKVQGGENSGEKLAQ